MEGNVQSSGLVAPGIIAIALAMLAGDTLVQQLPALPPGWVLLMLAGAGVALLWKPRWRLFAVLLLAVAWSAWRADLALAVRLPQALEHRDITVTGQVLGLPRADAEAMHVRFRVTAARRNGHPLAFHGVVRLAWYGHARDSRLRACSRWRLRVRLRRPRAFLDPGSFDSERRALQRGLAAVGYVRPHGLHRPLGTGGWCLDGARERVSRRIAELVPQAPRQALLQALAVGDKRGLDDADWRTARATGVSHLLAISGFHIGVAALAGVALVRLLWWLWPELGLRWPRPRVAALAGLLTALPYAALAGFALPTVRALLMIAVVALARWQRRATRTADVLALALLAVLVADPLAVLSAGFWLSFLGVALLVFGLAGRTHGGFLDRLGRAQALMSVALLPLTVAFFGQVAPLGALANLLAVPVVSLLVVPLTLLGVLCLGLVPWLAGGLMKAAGTVMSGLWWVLQHMAQWPLAHVYLPAAAWWALPVAMLGVLWLCAPRGLPARWLGALLCLPLLWPARPAIRNGGFRATVLDVGQGLSVMVRTAHHTLVFDTGARYPSGFSLGRAVVVPALRARGVRALNLLMISHGDNDHAGGTPAVLRAFPAPRRLSGEPGRVGEGMRPCRRGQHWRWDGVRLRVLSPPPDTALRRNDRSCVLLVSGRGGRLLLTGDITRRVEPAVVRRLPAGPPLVLVVPHHGSRTSSSQPFLQALQPSLAIVSAGWHNRYGHPAVSVVNRYRADHIRLINTATAGAVALAFPPNAAPRVLAQWRLRRPRYWRE